MGSFGHCGTRNMWIRTESPGRSHSHSLTDWGDAVCGEHRVPFCEDGPLTHNVSFGNGHPLEEGVIGHIGALACECGLLLFNNSYVLMEEQGPLSQFLQRRESRVD